MWGKTIYLRNAHLLLLFIADTYYGKLEDPEQINELRRFLKGVYVYLKRLQNWGKIRKIGRGKYEITSSGWKTVTYLKKRILDTTIGKDPTISIEIEDGKVVLWYPHPLAPTKLRDRIEDPKIFRISKWREVEF